MNTKSELNAFVSHYNDLFEKSRLLEAQTDEYKEDCNFYMDQVFIVVAVIEDFLNYPNMPVFLKPAPGIVWPNLYPDGYPSGMCHIDVDKLVEWAEACGHVWDYNESLKTLKPE